MNYDPRDYEIRIQYSAVPGTIVTSLVSWEWPNVSAHGDTRGGRRPGKFRSLLRVR